MIVMALLIIIVLMMMLGYYVYLITGFTNNVKNDKAIVLMDKSTVFSIILIFIIFLGFLLDFMMLIKNNELDQVSVYGFSLALLMISMYFLLSENITAYNEKSIFVLNKKYDIENILKKESKQGFANRNKIAIIFSYEGVEKKMNLRFSNKNYLKIVERL